MMPHPFVDMFSEIGPELGARHSIVVRRYGGGAWDATGRYTGQTFFDTPTDAVINPSTPKEVEKLPENERTKEAITLFTRNPLLTSDVNGQSKADEVIWNGRTYEVRLVADWTAQAQYAWSIATRKGA